MRIISRDGTIDVPYENSMIYRYEESILYVMCGSDTGKITGRLLASYRTTEKAEKAMEMLRNSYLDFMSEATPDGNGFCFNQPKIFRFPKDEDVEV